MNVSKCKCCFCLLFCLVVTGAFSLLWIRQQIYLQASKSKLLEKELAALVEVNKRADLCIAKIQTANSAKITHTDSRRMLWVTSHEPENITSIVAINR